MPKVMRERFEAIVPLGVRNGSVVLYTQDETHKQFVEDRFGKTIERNLAGSPLTADKKVEFVTLEGEE